MNFPIQDFYPSYVATYLERDVRQALNVSSLRDFDRFMRACAARSASILNKSELAKDVGISSATANEWLGVLQASNQITLLEPYFGNVSKRLIKSPKLYFNDTGLLCFLLGLSATAMKNSYLLGNIWETFVFSELRKSFFDHARGKIWFYRDRQREVDFIIDIDGELSLYECKWTELPSLADANNLAKVGSTLNKPIRSQAVIGRPKTSFPLSEQVSAINGFRLREHVLGVLG